MLQSLRELLRQERAKYPVARQRASYNKRFFWKYPLALELELRRKLQKLVQPTTQRLNSLRENITAQHTVYREDAEDFQSFQEYLQTMKQEEDSITGEVLLALMYGIANKVIDLNVSEMVRFMARYLGRDIEVDVADRRGILLAMGREIQARVKHYLDVYYGKVEKANNDLKLGILTLGAFTKTIDLLNKSLVKSVPDFIATDIIGNLVSRVQGSLLNALGIRHYTWQTERDEKVRGNPDGIYPKANPSHWLMDGVICDNTNEFIFSTDGRTWQNRYGKMPKAHPGEEYRCRCVRVPFILNILLEIDRSLANGRRNT